MVEMIEPSTAAWNQRIAFGLTHRYFAPNLIVQAEAQVPSITTRDPDLLAAATAFM